MAHRVLVLGGTMESRELAVRLAARTNIDVMLSLAGRTRQPIGYPVPLRIGGFGGKAGIDAFTELRWITVQTTARHYPF